MSIWMSQVIVYVAIHHASLFSFQELSVRLSNGSHQDIQLKASITSAMPYFLEQIQQGANYLMLAAERMATVDQHDHALITTVEVKKRMNVGWKI